MRTSRLVAATLLLTWTVSLASAADSAKPTAPTSASRAIAAKAPPPMGEPVNGLACSLSANRTDFHPGECLRMSGYLFCLGKEPLLLPLKSQTCSTTVHITNPDGHEYYVEGVLQTIRPEWDVGNAPILLKSETTAFLGRSELYLTEPISNYHPTFTDSTASTVPLSLRKLGEYRFWLEFEVPFEPKSQPETWSGRLKSNVLTIKVTDLPPEKRLKEPTAEQAANLASFLAQKQRLNDFPSNDRLKEALAWTENEGLALATVNKLKELDDKADPYGYLRHSLCFYLVCRAYYPWGDPPNPLLIDGPYLRPLAQYLLQTQEKALANAGNVGWNEDPGAGPLRQYLKSHPDDQELRTAANRLGERFAKISDADAGLPPFEDHPAQKNVAAHFRLNAAWKLLLATGRLHEGMSLAEAVTLLGEPSSRHDYFLSWKYPTPKPMPYSETLLHELVAEVDGDKVKNFKVDRR